MNAIVFEDRWVRRLEPIVLGRPAYAVSCGAMRLVDLIADLRLTARGVVRPHLDTIQRLDFPGMTGPARPRGPLLLLNARLVPDAATLPPLHAWINSGDPGCVTCGGQLAAAIAAPDQIELPELTPGPVCRWAEELRQRLPQVSLPLSLFDYPHDVIRHHSRILTANLDQRLKTGRFEMLARDVHGAPGATLHPSCACDGSAGPIVLDRGAGVGAFCLLEGPLYAGPSARVNAHALLRQGVAIGHTTKVGGEVQASIVEAFSNKQHHGYLGHAYLGSWVNLGAGTSNSDLKNTYGTIRVDCGDQRLDTRMQFLGCVVGDHTKTAINTTIFTGKLIGACSMIYGTVSTNVPSFANYAPQQAGGVTELPPEVVVTTQRRVLARRGLTPRSCDVQLIRDMYQLSRQDRQLVSKPPEF
jgi:glucose-1-phosphate thymidylyltransferase